MKAFNVAATLCTWVPALALAQGPSPGAAPAQPLRAREAAPVDLSGYWVSVVSEDWRWRMLTPLRGDFQSIPLNAEGRRVGLAWDPEQDEAEGLECKAYGAPAIMRIPGRVRISWQDEQTLKLEMDAGEQTRLFRFGASPAPDEPATRQGYSVANWERPLSGFLPPGGIPVFTGARIGQQGRSLEVKTTHLLPGYLRKNGPPYSADATVREYYDHHVQPNGDEWLTVTTVVTDSTYLAAPFVTSTDFKKESDDSGWDPTPCSAR